MVRRIVVIGLCLFAALPSAATHWLQYYIYIQKQYVQGPWDPATGLSRSTGYSYLEAVPQEDLFGTEPLHIALTIVERLQEKEPDRYNWNYEIQLNGDTVVITTSGQIPEKEVVQNELTASLLLNGYAGVQLKEGTETSKVLTLDDVTVPYFTLSTSHQPDQKEPEDEDTIQPEAPIANSTTTSDEQSQSSPPLLLYTSLAVNGILIGILLILVLKKKTR